MNIWKIEYREPILGGNREHVVKTPTLMNAVADFNLHKGGFDTPLRITRLAIGDYPETWTMQGRYDVPPSGQRGPKSQMGSCLESDSGIAGISR